MRLIALIASIALLLPSPAPAQVLLPGTPPPPVNQEGMRDFCIYGNQLYSLGLNCACPIRTPGCAAWRATARNQGGRAFWGFDSKEWPTSPACAAAAAVAVRAFQKRQVARLSGWPVSDGYGEPMRAPTSLSCTNVGGPSRALSSVSVYNGPLSSPSKTA